jgi:deazaflavin-dependent oxidoreductase (nitroreductase family)
VHLDSGLDQEDYCYLTTRGRVSGKPHTIEIWFTILDGVLYMLSGGRDRSDWVRNLEREPAVQLRIGDGRWDATARIAEHRDTDSRIRKAVADKYRARGSTDLDEWERRAMPIAVEAQRELPKEKEA